MNAKMEILRKTNRAATFFCLLFSSSFSLLAKVRKGEGVFSHAHTASAKVLWGFEPETTVLKSRLFLYDLARPLWRFFPLLSVASS